MACHEGYPGGEHDAPLLPLINLENAMVFRDPAKGESVVASKRNASIIANAKRVCAADTLIDVAYYNAMLSLPLLNHHPAARGVGIIRDCESFVRSSTTLTGEDPLPVGWPDPGKPLTQREQFIQLGRIRPNKRSPDGKNWFEWSAVKRNIWLWLHTNMRLIDASDAHPERFVLADFQMFKEDNAAFLNRICAHFGIQVPDNSVVDGVELGKVNKKGFGYQVGPSSDWTTEERALLEAAEQQVWSRFQ